MDTQIRNIMNDLPGAVRFMEQSQQNREQLYKWKTPGEQSAAPATAAAPSPFGQVCYIRLVPWVQSAHLSIVARAAAATGP
jgi:hypothetical protein